MTLLPVGLGVLAAFLLVLVGRWVGGRRENRVYAAGLVVAALIYVLLALVGGTSGREVGVELVGLALFGAVALIGMRFPLAIGLGWLGHVLWDVVLHRPPEAWVPEWYPALCLGFDVAVGLYVSLISWRSAR